MRTHVAIVFLLTLLGGCGMLDDSPDTSNIRQAQNHGQVCQGSNGGPYDPFNPNQGWPLHGYCVWMPGPDGYNSPSCSNTPGHGQVQIYDQIQPARHSNCALLPPSTDLDFSNLAYNGWDGLLSGNSIRIRWFDIGPRTWVSMSKSPTYNAYDGATLANCSDTVIYHYGPNFEVASLLVYNYGGPCLD